MTTRRWLFTLVATLVSVSSGTAESADPPRRDPKRADALFSEGKASMKRGDYDVACGKFDESERLDPAPGTLRWLAECEENRGKFLSAATRLQAAIDMRPDEDLLRLCREQAAELSRRTPKINLRIDPSFIAGASVFLDGSKLPSPSARQTIAVDPGEHTIEIVAPDAKKQTKRTTIAPGETKEVAFESNATNRPRGTESDPIEEAPGRGPWPYVFGGVGIAGVAVATVVGLKLGSTKTEISDCRPDCTPDQRSKADSAKGLIPVYYAAGVIGIAGIGVGAYLFLAGSDGKRGSASLYVGPGSVNVRRQFL